MKSEYDKMFYQHQSMMTGKPPTPEMMNLSKANLAAAASAKKEFNSEKSESAF